MHIVPRMWRQAASCMASYCVWTVLLCRRPLGQFLSVLFFDTFVDHPAERMGVDGKPNEIPVVQREVQVELDRVEGRPQGPAGNKKRHCWRRAKYSERISGLILPNICFRSPRLRGSNASKVKTGQQWSAPNKRGQPGSRSTSKNHRTSSFGLASPVL